MCREEYILIPKSVDLYIDPRSFAETPQYRLKLAVQAPPSAYISGGPVVYLLLNRHIPVLTNDRARFLLL